VEPLLENEERRDEFDIVAYAERLLANFDAADGPRGKKSRGEGGDAGGPRPFAELANCTDKYEVCRMFLATLQLTNQGNVELSTAGSLETGDLEFNVNLLSRHRHPAREM
jgi:condensin-2 complex subunit H2